MKLNPNLIYSEPEVDFTIGIDEAIKKSEDNLVKLQQKAITAFAKHPFLGNYFRLNVADGYAYYQTIEFDKKKDKYLCVRCAGICLDEYSDGYIGESRWVDSDYVESNIQWRINMEKIFSPR
jgi:hypothetical protein